MPGMSSQLGTGSPYVTARFNQALWHELAILTLLILGAIVIVGLVMRHHSTDQGPTTSVELPVRKLLRVGFGIIWIIDGLLQLQPQMPIGMPTQIISPAAAGAPGWVQHLVSDATTVWLRHDILAAAAVVWIQLGLGLWLLFADRGWWSRAAGWASVGWAAVVWVVGNALGTLFIAPISWTTGAPGAVLFYAVAGVAIGLPPAWLARRSLAVWSARAMGALLLWLALVQAWPGARFWASGHRASVGPLGAMARSMAATEQPSVTASIARAYESAALHDAWAVNAVVVLGLLFVSVCLLVARARWVRPAVIVYVVMALVDWATVQNFAVFGGVATDINSMIPSALIVIAIGMLVSSTTTDEEHHVPVAQVDVQPSMSTTRLAGTVGAAVMFAFGAIPMLLLGVLPGTSPDVAAASSQGVIPIREPAPGFTLTDQDGQSVSLASFRGTTVVLSFLDPVCTTDCPIEAQQMKDASEQLGPSARVAFVAVASNPIIRSEGTIKTFDEVEGMNGVHNWYFLTGSVAQLRKVWNDYGVTVAAANAGSMVVHSEPDYVINPEGKLVVTWNSVTGSGATSLDGASGTALIVNEAKQAS